MIQFAVQVRESSLPSSSKPQNGETGQCALCGLYGLCGAVCKALVVCGLCVCVRRAVCGAVGVYGPFCLCVCVLVQFLVVRSPLTLRAVPRAARHYLLTFTTVKSSSAYDQYPRASCHSTKWMKRWIIQIVVKRLQDTTYIGTHRCLCLNNGRRRGEEGGREGVKLSGADLRGGVD